MYLYLLHEREFININQNIYKLHFTNNNINLFINEIPKNSNILLFYYIDMNKININIFNIILKRFIKYFKQRNDIGENYFEGNLDMMIEIINDILYNKIYIEYKNMVKENIYWWEN